MRFSIQMFELLLSRSWRVYIPSRNRSDINTPSRHNHSKSKVPQEESSDKKKSKTTDSGESRIGGFMKRIKVKQQAMKIAPEVKQSSHYAKNLTPKDEPYFMRRQSSVCSKLPTDVTVDSLGAAENTDTISVSIDKLVENFRGSFDSPNSTLSRPKNKNYVKKMVAAFEEKYGSQNSCRVQLSPVKSKLNFNESKSPQKSATVRRVPKCQAPVKTEVPAVVIEQEVQSLDDTMDTVATTGKLEPSIERFWSDQMLQERQLKNVDPRLTRSCPEPQIIGALLKKPVRVENTKIDWIPIASQKLPGKRSLRRLISKMAGKRKLTKDLDTSGLDFYDMSMDESMTQEPSIKEEVKKNDEQKEDIENIPVSSVKKRKSWSRSLSQAPKKARDFCSLPKIITKKKTRVGTPLKEIFENNNYIDSKHNMMVPENVKVILHEVPAVAPLAPSYQKVVDSTTSTGASPKETVVVKNSPLDRSFCEDTPEKMSTFRTPFNKVSPVQFLNSTIRKSAVTNTRFSECLDSGLKFSNKGNSDQCSTPCQPTQMRKKSVFPTKRPRSDALDDVKSFYRRYDCVDADVHNLVQRNEPVYGNDIILTMHKLKLQSTPDKFADLSRCNAGRPRSAVLDTRAEASVEGIESYAAKIRGRYLSSKLDVPGETPKTIKGSGKDQSGNEELVRPNRSSAFFENRMKNANFDTFLKPEMNQMTGWAQESALEVPKTCSPVFQDHLRSNKTVLENTRVLNRGLTSPRPLSGVDHRMPLHTYKLHCNLCPNQMCVLRS